MDLEQLALRSLRGVQILDGETVRQPAGETARRLEREELEATARSMLGDAGDAAAEPTTAAKGGW